MTKTQHTPGPWKLISGVMVAADGRTLAASSGRPEAETEANMRLIAAAPELLAAARLVAQRWPNWRGDGETLRAINTAIAKAEN